MVVRGPGRPLACVYAHSSRSRLHDRTKRGGLSKQLRLGPFWTNLLGAAFRLLAQLPPQQKDNDLGPALHGHTCICQQLLVPLVAMALVS